ncbi:MAG: DinB family protein [Flavobacteriaceae bacterium]|nr:DinB family protein [Flavobacteriaceae bacterium]
MAQRRLMIFETTTQQLRSLHTVIDQIPPADLCKPLPVLSGSSVGMHVRHILEFYICLTEGFETGMVDYDKRARKMELETKPEIIKECIINLTAFVANKPANKPLELHADYGSVQEPRPVKTPTSLHRELLYNIEHGVHHMALIKIGLQHLDCKVKTESGFGVASSTIRNQKICAQ